MCSVSTSIGVSSQTLSSSLSSSSLSTSTMKDRLINDQIHSPFLSSNLVPSTPLNSDQSFFNHQSNSNLPDQTNNDRLLSNSPYLVTNEISNSNSDQLVSSLVKPADHFATDSILTRQMRNRQRKSINLGLSTSCVGSSFVSPPLSSQSAHGVTVDLCTSSTNNSTAHCNMSQNKVVYDVDYCTSSGYQSHSRQSSWQSQA